MKLKMMPSPSSRLSALCLAALLPLTTTSATDLAQVPLYTVAPVPPNIFFLHDDSSSMDNETLIDNMECEGGLGREDAPGYDYTASGTTLEQKVHQVPGRRFKDNCKEGANYLYVLDVTTSITVKDEVRTSPLVGAAAEEEWRVRFHEINPLYYNPRITYRPWPGPNPNDGNKPFSDMKLEAAWIEPAVGSSARETIDLTRDSAAFYDVTNQNSPYTRNYYDNPNWTGWCQTYAPGTTCRGWRYYYRETPGGPIKVQWVKDLTSEAEKTNFANWFTYHRSRKNVAKYAIGTAIKGATGKRLGYGAINDIANGTTNDIAFIKDNNDTAVFTKLYNTFGNGDTPLQKGLDWVGRYYEIGESGDAGDSPILSASKGGTCQLNNTVLITDGIYTGSKKFTNSANAVGNTDGDNGAPYADSYPNTLADVAMHYYERDLAKDLDNRVPTGVANKYLHQHMNTYTISLGMKGTIGNTDTVDINTITWPDPRTAENVSTPARIDDLFHAAVNGRGKFFMASESEKLTAALNTIIGSVNTPSNSSNTVATSSFRLDGSDLAITTSFDPAHWSGTVKALRVNGEGTLNETTPAWSSDKTLLFGATDRQIITYDGVSRTGIPFQWSDIAASSHAAEITEEQLEYLRGKENSRLRHRTTVLGDIINSSPVHVGAPNLLYPDADPFGADKKRYSNFWKENKSRTPMVYVGANDGMLHGFRMSDGKELLAYAPGAIFNSLKNITDPDFDTHHQYFVDQTPTVSDAYFNDAWHTVLVSGLGAGGRGLFALDITHPASFSEANASSIALWEFTNADLGYTLAKPVIAMAENGKWIVISGNGYDSDSGKAALFIINLTNSGDYLKIETGNQTGNGLFSPTAVDSDGNGRVDRVYAGDLKGNLWVFDLSGKSGTNASDWKLAYDGKPLFTAKDSDAKVQPITSKPTVILNPNQPTRAYNKPNMLVLFGTGRYLNRNDLNNGDSQSFYAVWDDGHGNALTRDNLAAQTLITGNDATLRIPARLTRDIHVDYGATTGTKQYGWYLDLSTPKSAPSERVFINATVLQGILFFTTYIPSDDPCKGGGESWLMTMKAYNGGPPDKPIISINNNRTIEADKDVVDLDGANKAPSGLKLEGGTFGLRITQDSIITQQTGAGEVDNEVKPMENHAHNLGAAANLGKRISWRELRRE